MTRIFWGILLLSAAAACDSRAPAPPAPASREEKISTTLTGDPVEGGRLYNEKGCAACHGPTALGGIGKRLANTPLPFREFLSKIRNAMPPKPAMNAEDLPETQAYSIFLWLESVDIKPAQTLLPPAHPALPPGQILGMQLWIEKGCGACHGAFGQGSPRAPALAGQDYPFERQRAMMRRLAAQNAAHGAKNISDEMLKRLLDWLRRGANPASGC